MIQGFNVAEVHSTLPPRIESRLQDYMDIRGFHGSRPPARLIWGIDAIGLTQPSFRAAALPTAQTGHLADIAAPRGRSREHGRLKYWEIIADKIAASGWTWGYCIVATASGSHYIVDAHCGDVSGFR